MSYSSMIATISQIFYLVEILLVWIFLEYSQVLTYKKVPIVAVLQTAYISLLTLTFQCFKDGKFLKRSSR